MFCTNPLDGPLIAKYSGFRNNQFGGNFISGEVEFQDKFSGEFTGVLLDIEIRDPNNDPSAPISYELILQVGYYDGDFVVCLTISLNIYINPNE